MRDLYYEDLSFLESLNDKKKLIKDIYISFKNFQEIVMKEISKKDRIKIDSLKIVDSYLNVRNSLNLGYYDFGSNRIDLNNEIKYFEKCEQVFDYFNNIYPNDEYIDLDELDVIKDLMNDEDDYVELLCLFVKWVLVKDKHILNKLIDFISSRAFFYEFVTITPNKFWISKYEDLLSTEIDERLFKNVAFIDHFYWNNKKYIKAFLTKVRQENILFNDLENTFSFGNVIERKIISLELFIDYGEWNLLPIREQNSLNITIEEAKEIYEDKELFYAYLDTLTEKEKCEAGYFALFTMFESIESLNILRLILFELKKENKKYKNIYRIIDNVLNDLLETYFAEFDIEDVVNSDTIYYELPNIVGAQLKTVFEQMLKAVSDINVSDLMQAKKQMTLYYKFCEPNNCDEIERRVDSIYQILINLISKEEKYKLFMDRIIAGINDNLKDKITNNNKILSSLTSAELLYDEYIRKGAIINDFDYSLISCGYYKSIELLTNSLFYEPYKDYIQSKNIQINEKKMFGGATCCYNDRSGNVHMKDSIEIGPMSYLLKNILKNNMFKQFLIDTYGNLKLNDIAEMGNVLFKIKNRRNKAVHDCDITYYEADADKKIVYEEKDYLEVKELHDIFHKILSIF